MILPIVTRKKTDVRYGVVLSGVVFIEEFGGFLEGSADVVSSLARSSMMRSSWFIVEVPSQHPKRVSALRCIS